MVRHFNIFLYSEFTAKLVLAPIGKIPKKYISDFSKDLLFDLALSYANVNDLKHY